MSVHLHSAESNFIIFGLIGYSKMVGLPNEWGRYSDNRFDETVKGLSQPQSSNYSLRIVNF